MTTKTPATTPEPSPDPSVEPAEQSAPEGALAEFDKIPSSAYDVDGGMAVLKREVIREFFFPNTTTPSHSLLFHKGQRVPIATIERMNEDAKLAKARADDDGVDQVK